MRERLSVSDSFKVLKMIEANGKAENGIFTYNPGWDDGRISRELDIAEPAIAYRRKEAFGDLRSGRPSETAQRVDTIEVAQTAMRVDIHDLKKRMSAMEKALNILMTGANRPELEKTVGKDQLDALKQHFNGRVS